ncbi:uncharacterized protein N7483_010852 [Penicillium malachiteum]|uniref:uncharacterized protein n=1 Tax=Penicillium malachiteum TaxID=1324776 RepID=UPI002547B035|nr:uncharacterized protein N7483_010852 [Penicillium malachiteum]KAJ5713671.1 hypothetical protein N7483_010852 [Penicillium malachiteum]
MPPQPWKSQTCEPCRKKKIKCDKKWPCQACTKHGRLCERPIGSIASHHRQIVRATPPPLQPLKLEKLQVSSPLKPWHIKLVGWFIGVYMPRDFLPAQTPQKTVSLWYKHLPQSLGQSELYDQALVALSLLVIAISDGNTEFFTKSLQLYSTVSAKLADPTITEKLHPEHQIGIAMAMNVYEFWHSTACREATVFSEPAWRKRTQDSHSYDELLDILLQVPTFSHNMNLYTSKYGSKIPKSIQDQMSSDFTSLELQLLHWYWNMQLNHPAPIFDLDPYNPSDTLYVPPGSTHNVLFPTYETYEALCLCWTGLASLYLVGVEMTWLGSPNDLQDTTSPANSPNSTPFTPTYFYPYYSNPDIPLITSLLNQGGSQSAAECNNLTQYFSTRICQAAAQCMRDGFPRCGLQLYVAPMWFAGEIFADRSTEKSKWCNMVMAHIADRGLKFARIAKDVRGSEYIKMKEGNYQPQTLPDQYWTWTSSSPMMKTEFLLGID